MPTSCVPKHYCGTHAPGWLSGSHPTRVGQVVNAKVCFHWGGSCCNWNANIQIKRCNGFYVYKLARTPVCWLRYCGNAGFGKFHSNLKICFLINYRSSNSHILGRFSEKYRIYFAKVNYYNQSSHQTSMYSYNTQ